jgi:hypothetical protein
MQRSDKSRMYGSRNFLFRNLQEIGKYHVTRFIRGSRFSSGIFLK